MIIKISQVLISVRNLHFSVIEGVGTVSIISIDIDMISFSKK